VVGVHGWRDGREFVPQGHCGALGCFWENATSLVEVGRWGASFAAFPRHYQISPIGLAAWMLELASVGDTAQALGESVLSTSVRFDLGHPPMLTVRRTPLAAVPQALLARALGGAVERFGQAANLVILGPLPSPQRCDRQSDLRARSSHDRSTHQTSSSEVGLQLGLLGCLLVCCPMSSYRPFLSVRLPLEEAM
jgi:hypothetical protein